LALALGWHKNALVKGDQLKMNNCREYIEKFFILQEIYAWKLSLLKPQAVKGEVKEPSDTLDKI